MKKIILGSTAIVTDPCYKIPTWCQNIVDNVLPGEYIVDVEKSNQGGWGNRISELSCIHENHINDYLTYKESETIIGVDSGQAGVFDIRSYRNDEQSKSYGIEDNFGYGSEEDGDEWYGIISNLSLGDDQWGTYSHGVVSSSGYGDGDYTLLLAEVDNNVVGFKIIFIEEDLNDMDYDDDNYRFDDQD